MQTPEKCLRFGVRLWLCVFSMVSMCLCVRLADEKQPEMIEHCSEKRQKLCLWVQIATVRDGSKSSGGTEILIVRMIIQWLTLSHWRAFSRHTTQLTRCSPSKTQGRRRLWSARSGRHRPDGTRSDMLFRGVVQRRLQLLRVTSSGPSQSAQTLPLPPPSSASAPDPDSMSAIVT